MSPGLPVRVLRPRRGYCRGNTLAKLQSTIALQELVAAVPDPHLAVDPEQIEFPDGLSTRAPASVPDGW